MNILIHGKHHLITSSQTFSGCFPYKEETTVIFLETRSYTRHTDQDEIHVVLFPVKFAILHKLFSH